jgi:hypothetical protein
LRERYNYGGIDVIPLIKNIPIDIPFDKDDMRPFCDVFLGENINKNVRNGILSFYFDCSCGKFSIVQ